MKQIIYFLFSAQKSLKNTLIKKLDKDLNNLLFFITGYLIKNTIE
jgi:hypothetical protein